MACSLRVAILEFWADDGILNAIAERGVRTAAAGRALVNARRIVKYQKSRRS